MFDATFWIFFGVFFAAWIGCVPLLYFGAKKFFVSKDEVEAG